MGWIIVSVVLGIVCIFQIIYRHFYKVSIKDLENSNQIQKEFNETKISKLNEKMKEGFDTKSKALEKSEELRLAVISELDDKKFHFKKLERDLATSHKLYGILLKKEEALEAKFIQLRDHYDSIVSVVKLPRELISKKSNLEKRLKNVG